jgi:2-keto-4-pentenoate hydratase/2-oxohepta-3-ene-1,7-dioic acid hydratase in catechol pathway
VTSTVSTWQLVTAELAEGERATRAAIAVGTDLYAPDFLATFRGAIDVLRQWDALADRLREWVPRREELLLGPVRLCQPLQYPAKVLCSGPNFTDHLAEMGVTSLGEQWKAYFFLKPPTTTLIGDGEAILLDNPESDQADWEGELAVVIGQGGRLIPAETALDHVAGYLVANDVSLRGPHRRTTPAQPFQWDWLASKAADTTLPLGPGIVPTWQIPDPQALTITTRVNGVVKQKGNTADMVLSVAELIADASHLMTLEPGDVILTGTPAGVGLPQGTFLEPGDEVEVAIEAVGTLRNPVRRRRAQ